MTEFKTVVFKLFKTRTPFYFSVYLEELPWKYKQNLYQMQLISSNNI